MQKRFRVSQGFINQTVCRLLEEEEEEELGNENTEVVVCHGMQFYHSCDYRCVPRDGLLALVEEGPNAVKFEL